MVGVSTSFSIAGVLPPGGSRAGKGRLGSASAQPSQGGRVSFAPGLGDRGVLTPRVEVGEEIVLDPLAGGRGETRIAVRVEEKIKLRGLGLHAIIDARGAFADVRNPFGEIRNV